MLLRNFNLLLFKYQFVYGYSIGHKNIKYSVKKAVELN